MATRKEFFAVFNAARRWKGGFPGNEQYQQTVSRAETIYNNPEMQAWYIGANLVDGVYDAGNQDVLIALKGTITPEQVLILREFFKWIKRSRGKKYSAS
jgi:hypothetical protein